MPHCSSFLGDCFLDHVETESEQRCGKRVVIGENATLQKEALAQKGLSEAISRPLMPDQDLRRINHSTASFAHPLGDLGIFAHADTAGAQFWCKTANFL